MVPGGGAGGRRRRGREGGGGGGGGDGGRARVMGEVGEGGVALGGKLGRGWRAGGTFYVKNSRPYVVPKTTEWRLLHNYSSNRPKPHRNSHSVHYVILPLCVSHTLDVASVHLADGDPIHPPRQLVTHAISTL